VKLQLVKQAGKSSFATRIAAADMRAKFQVEIHEVRSGDSVEIDLAGVEAMTISYADELIAKLAAERRIFGTSDWFFSISNATEEVAETIEVALERRNLFLVHESEEGFELLAAPDHLVFTFDAALELGEFTARELADQLGISLPAANNRIKSLTSAGAVIRERSDPTQGGRQYLYRIEAAA
jgi:hypothetical protein